MFWKCKVKQCSFIMFLSIIWLSSRLTLNVPDEDYSRNAPSTINWISALLFIIMKKRVWRYQRVIRVRKVKTKRQHNVTLCKVNILLNASCNCGTPCEHFRQFISGYNTYTDYGEIVFNNLYWLSSNINIDVNLLTKGNDLLTYQENTTILKHVFQYIKDSKRFTNV